MNHVMFDEMGFRGNTDGYYNPSNSYISDVLETKLGIPISLAVIYVSVADRLGVRLHGVNAPWHFLLRTEEDAADGRRYIDVFNGYVHRGM